MKKDQGTFGLMLRLYYFFQLLCTLSLVFSWSRSFPRENEKPHLYCLSLAVICSYFQLCLLGHFLQGLPLPLEAHSCPISSLHLLLFLRHPNWGKKCLTCPFPVHPRHKHSAACVPMFSGSWVQAAIQFGSTVCFHSIWGGSSLFKEPPFLLGLSLSGFLFPPMRSLPKTPQRLRGLV